MRHYRTTPGVLLFRLDPDRAPPNSTAGEPKPAPSGAVGGKVLAVYLVGEAPVWGVQTQALTTALDLASHSFHVPPYDSLAHLSLPIQVLGPTFSGSTRSLASGLANWLDGVTQRGRAKCSRWKLPDSLAVDVLSGTATSPGNGTVLTKILHGYRVRYGTMAADDDALQSCLWNRFVPHRLGLQTSFYPKSGRAGTAGPCAVKKDSTESRSENGRVAVLAEKSLYGSDFAGSGFHVLPFPANISYVRAAYDAQRRQQLRAGAPTSPESLPATSLDLDLTENRPSRDDLPLFDVQRSSRTQDLVLTNILTTIAANRIEVVAIAASNVMDKLFLASVLRAHAPDVRLVTFEGDLLLAHPEYTPATKGMLVVSSNPLSEPDPLEPPSRDVELQFASDTAQGVYKATKELISGEGAGVRHPDEVWLSAVGRGTLVPLERVCLEGDASCGSHGSDDAQRALGLGTDRHPSPPRGWTLVFCFAGLFILFTVSGAAHRTVRNRPFLGVEWRRLIPRRRGVAPADAFPSRLVQGLVVLIPAATAVPYLLLGGPYLYRSQKGAGWIESAMVLVPTSWDDAIRALLVVSPLCLALAAVVLYAGLAQRTWGDVFELPWKRRDETLPPSEASPRTSSLLKRAARLSAPLLLATTGIVGAAVLVAFGLDHLGSKPGLTLFLERSIAVGKGVSPVLPVIMALVIVVGWVLASLWRGQTLDRLPTPGELGVAPSADDPLGPSAPSLDDRLARAILLVRDAVNPASFWIRDNLFQWGLLVCIPVAYLSLYYGSAGPIVRGFDAPWLDWAESLLIVASVVLLLGSSLSLCTAWGALRRWLADLKALRFGPATPRSAALWLTDLSGAANPGGPSRRELFERCETTLGSLEAEFETACGDSPEEGSPTVTLVAHLAPVLRVTAESMRARSCRVWLALARWGAAEASREPVEGEEAAPVDGQPAAAEDAPLVVLSREFFVCQTATFTREALLQIGQLMAYVAAGLLVLFLAVASYPFEPRRVTLFYFGSLVVLGTLQIAVVIYQMERNSVLRLRTGTDSGAFAWAKSLSGRLLLFAGVPLLGMLASQVPELNRLVTGWLEPVLKAFL